MENLLPTITVLMAEASVVLLVLLVGVVFFNTRRKRQHQAEIDALMEMANGTNIALPGRARAGAAPAVGDANPTAVSSSPDESADAALAGAPPSASDRQPAAAKAAAEPVGAREEKQPSPAAHAPQPAAHHHEHAPKPQDTNAERIRQIDDRLAEMRHALELIDGKINRFRQDHQKLAATVLRTLEKSGKETLALRQEFEPIQQILHDVRTWMATAPIPAAAPARAEKAQEHAHPATASAPAEARSALPPRQPASAPVAMDVDAGTESTENDEDYVLDAATLERLVRPAEYGATTRGIAVEEIDLDDLDPRIVMEAEEASSPFSARDQIFFQSSTAQGMKQGWYFSAAGSDPQGPFADKLTAELVMEEITGRSPRTQSGQR